MGACDRIARKREEIVREALSLVFLGEPKLTAFKRAATKHNVGKRSLERWVSAYRKDGLAGLIPKRVTAGGMPIDPRIQELIAHVVRRSKHTSPRWRAGVLHKLIRAGCIEQQLKPPSRTTIDRYRRALR